MKSNEFLERFGRRRRFARGFLRPLAGLFLFALLLTGTGQESALSQVAPKPRLDYVAFGDSTSLGSWASNRDTKGYVALYRAYATDDTGATISLKNMGHSAWTSSDLRSALRKNSKFRQNTRSAEVVTWNIGHVDLYRAGKAYKNRTCGGADNQNCLRLATAKLKANWEGIVKEIVSLRSSNSAVIRTMDLYQTQVSSAKVSDSWPNDGGLKDFEVTKAYLDDVNDHIAKVSAENGILHARVNLAFNGPNGDEDPAEKGYIAADGFHPNDLGHKVIADELRKLGYEPLR